MPDGSARAGLGPTTEADDVVPSESRVVFFSLEENGKISSEKSGRQLSSRSGVNALGTVGAPGIYNVLAQGKLQQIKF